MQISHTSHKLCRRWQVMLSLVLKYSETTPFKLQFVLLGRPILLRPSSKFHSHGVLDLAPREQPMLSMWVLIRTLYSAKVTFSSRIEYVIVVSLHSCKTVHSVWSSRTQLLKVMLEKFVKKSWMKVLKSALCKVASLTVPKLKISCNFTDQWSKTFHRQLTS